jgi:hypothetical protein
VTTTIIIRATITAATKRPVFTLQLRPKPDCVDPIKALRSMLKQAQRQFHLKCVSARENKEDDNAAATTTADSSHA